jgi:hypothetical protein
MTESLFAPPGGFAVRIMDLSGGNGGEPLETVRGFTSLMHANAFARAYVRDSFERCRAPGLSNEEVLSAWFAYGEDAVVEDEAGWRSANELHDFAAAPAVGEERDWRALDPRRHGEERDEDGDDEEGEDQTG